MGLKGQMFLVGAFVLCMLLATVIIGKNAIVVSVPQDQARNMFTNMLSESKNTLNIIAKENPTTYNIKNRLLEYMIFLDRTGKDHKTNISGYFIVGMPSGDGMNVTIANFGKETMSNIIVRINESEKTVSSLEHNNATTLVFENAPDYLKFNYTYSDPDAETFTEEVNTTKRLFCFVKLRFLSEEDLKQSVSFN